MAVALRVASARARRYARALRADAAALLAAMGLGRCELSVLVVDDAAIRALNREFRAKDSPTDVLSFSQLDEVGQPAPDPNRLNNAATTILGDVVISIDTALRQAREYEVAPAARLRTLMIHGLLHLIGYDHERSPSEARRMFARERALTTAIAAKGARRPIPARKPGTGKRKLR
ncbi:MAG TPA: rRNA maturation RNase YbeY [Candidatus Binataceae bacterium]|nr:rRNA maturation RNase YbeY [Candidatus Binataceae bacterium]